MRKIVLVFCMAVALTGCNFSLNSNSKRVICRGDVIVKNLETELNLRDFDQIVINGAADIQYVQNERFSVKVEANEQVFEHLNYSVENGVLKLENKDNVQIVADKFDVYISSPVLKAVGVNGASDASILSLQSEEDLAITVNGAGDIELKNITVPTLSFTINGAGDLDAQGLDVEKLLVSVNGAGDVDVSGKAGYASFSVSGAGDVDARGLECDNIEKRKSGVASIRTRN